MSELAVRPTSDLAITADQTMWTDKQKAALVQLGVKDASNADLAVFFHQAARTGLDPFAKQIYMIGRWSQEGTKQTIQTGIDGYRLVARRAADAAGEKLRQSEPLWCGKDMQWLEAWPFDEPPVAAKVVAYRDGEPFAGVAMYREFVQTNRNGTPNSMWSRMPANQLAKCAEAQALRKAFPQELSGIYVDAEMGQAERGADGSHVVTSAPARRVTAAEIAGEPAAEPVDGELVEPPATAAQVQKLVLVLNDHGIESDEAQRQFCAERVGRPITSRKELTKAEAHRIIDELEQLGTPPAPEGGAA